MKRCALCRSTARVYCDSDRASLCWSCDAKVHSANFLVARHSRSLLCQLCHSPTPWSASGEKLSPSTASICGRCVFEGSSDDDDDDDDREERVGGDDGDVTELEDSVNENDNQIVPWSSTPDPPAVSSSSGDGGVLLKRRRQNVSDLTSEDEHDCSSANNSHHSPAVGDETTSFHSAQSSYKATTRNIEKIRRRNVKSGEHMSAQLDLNSPSSDS